MPDDKTDPLMELIADGVDDAADEDVTEPNDIEPEPEPDEDTVADDSADDKPDDTTDADDTEPEPEPKPDTSAVTVADAGNPKLILDEMQAAQDEARQAVSEYKAAQQARADARKLIKEADDALDKAEALDSLVAADEAMESAQAKYQAAQAKYEAADQKHQGYQRQVSENWFTNFGKSRGVKASDARDEYERLCESYEKKYPNTDVRALAVEKLEEWATSKKPAASRTPRPQVRATGGASSGGKGDAKSGEVKLDPFGADKFLGF